MSLRRHWQVLLPWFVVVAYAAELYVHWHQLGNRLATHFSASGVPNGWQSKNGFALASILIIAATLVAFLVIINAYGWSSPQKRQQMFAAYYAVPVFVGFIFWGLIQQNLHHGGALSTILAIVGGFGAGALGYWVGSTRVGAREDVPRSQ